MISLFSVVILMRSQVVGGGSGEDFLYEESTRLVEAANEQEATHAAEQLGRAAQHAYSNDRGEQVEWVFEEVLEVQDLCEDAYFPGIEVHSKLFRSTDYPRREH